MIVVFFVTPFVVYVCIGEYVHFPLLIPSVKDINNSLKLKAVIYYMYVLGIIMHGIVCCVIEATYIFYISQSRKMGS
jgi:hypothetical protein